jgi:hypothetical protein
MASSGCMFIPLDIYTRARKSAIKAKGSELVDQYMALESSNKLMQVRIGFAWMYPKEEDPTHRSFRAGIKYILLHAACGPWDTERSSGERHRSQSSQRD